MENSTSTDVDGSCNMRKVQFELVCGFAETYFTDSDKFGISICLWTQHLNVLPVSWSVRFSYSSFPLMLWFPTDSSLTQCNADFFRSVVFFFSDRSLRVSLPLYRCHSVPFRISPTASQSPWRLAVYRRKKVRANWAEVSPWGMERWPARLVKVNKGWEEKAWQKRGKKTSWISNKSPCELLIVSSGCLHFGSWSLIPYRFRPVIFWVFLHDMTPVKKQA